tara:strand:+ start:5861 stop:6595 length:735 start_codon:yes stop_codon:yes gene_type:complete
MILKVIYSLLRTNELLGLCNEIKIYLKSLSLEGLNLDASIEKFTQKHDEALEASNRSRSSQYTNQLREKDTRRDESFIAFRNYIEACTHRKDEATVNLAEKICRIIRSHGWILYNNGAKVQSAKMASLTKELELEENKLLITALAADAWYTDMVLDNNAYNQLKEDRSVAESNQRDFDTVALYKDLRVVSDELFETIEVMNRISPDAKYVEIANFINDCTKKYAVAARTRKTKSANSELEEQEV